MHLEEWTRFIGYVLAEPAFKTVATAALHALYQRPVIVTDGTGDGGVDAWIEMGAAGRVPVQFHSGISRDWQDKLLEDLEKPAVKAAAARRLLFVCGQTPTDQVVRRRKAEIETSHGIAVEVIDARAIASLALEDSTVLASLEGYLPVAPAAEGIGRRTSRTAPASRSSSSTRRAPTFGRRSRGAPLSALSPGPQSPSSKSKSSTGRSWPSAGRRTCGACCSVSSGRSSPAAKPRSKEGGCARAMISSGA